MRLRTRAFLLCFLPFAVLLAGSFWLIQSFVGSTVRDGLRNSVREGQRAIAKMNAQSDLQNSRFLRIAGENTSLKAGMQLLFANPQSIDARNTVEDQLRELGEHMGFDFMLVSAPDESPLAGVARETSSQSFKGQLIPLNTLHVDYRGSGLLLLGDRIFWFASVPVDESDDNIGVLSVGELFDLSDFTNLVALIHNGKVIRSNVPGVSQQQLERGLESCKDRPDCDLNLNGAHWISTPLQSYGGGYTLVSLENIDMATGPTQTRLDRLFLQLAFVSLIIALLCSVASSKSIAMPIGAVVSQLRNTVHTGKLSEIECQPSSILEIQELAHIYNAAANSVKSANDHLESAYLEFVGSLASALDARDQYTAGHSLRVSKLSSALASALQTDAQEVERVRIGALLHDIGKIGIADSVLQKPGRLTDKEFEIVKLHPVIGRKILEGVHGFAPYLAAVEFHHENWDGTGYPSGMSGQQIPLDARIVHVADAYDAMTTDRSYRRGVAHEIAKSILIEKAGTQFDARVVDAFVRLPRFFFAKETGSQGVLGTRRKSTVNAGVV